MINITAGRTVAGVLMIAFFSGAAHADFSIPESAGQLVGLAGLSGENQGAAMDGGAQPPGGSMSALSHDVCQSYFGDDWWACQHGLSGWSCSSYTDFSQWMACDRGKRQYDRESHEDDYQAPGDGGGGGLLDPLFGLAALGAAVWLRQGKRV